MSDTFRRVAGDQATYGYRQLPSAGSEGPDLKTLVYAGIGVALGIMVGTVMADRSWRSLIPPAQHQLVQASSSGSGSVDRPAAKVVQTLEAKVQQKPPQQAQQRAQTGPAPSTVQKTPAIQPSVAANAPAVRKAAVTRKESVARQASVVHIASGARSVPGTHRASAAHRRRPVRRSAAWKRHFARHGALRRHRLRGSRKAAITGASPPIDQALKPDVWSTPFVFTVEGELTVSAYDALTGTIETYEGETFALRQAAGASSGIQGESLSPNIHYKCNQFGSCTLIAGQFVLNANRTR